MAETVLGWAVGACLLFWFVGAHNRLVRLRSAAWQAYLALDAALVRQLTFVRAHCAAPAGNGNDRETASLHAAVAQLDVLLDATRARPLDAAALHALCAALHALLAAWQRQYPKAMMRFEADGSLSNRVLSLSADAGEAERAGMPFAWPEPSPAAEMARSQFNQRIAQYNAAVGQFPALLVAWIFGLRAAAPLS